jgi:hypothetical protein
MTTIDNAGPLCEENYIYCAVPVGEPFPVVPKLPAEWYDLNAKECAQLEFRKYKRDTKCSCCGNERKNMDPYTGWMVSPVVYTSKGEKRFDQFAMDDEDVLELWMKVYKSGGVVSDGYINLFGGGVKV